MPATNIFKKNLTGKILPLYEQDKELFEDLLIDSDQNLETAKINLKIATNIRQAYSTILNNELNKILKFLTSITIILTLSTAIFSFYGMNINLPLQGLTNAYIYISFFTFFIILTIFIIFFKKDWL